MNKKIKYYSSRALRLILGCGSLIGAAIIVISSAGWLSQIGVGMNLFWRMLISFSLLSFFIHHLLNMLIDKSRGIFPIATKQKKIQQKEK